jgi:hypothetical protein
LEYWASPASEDASSRGTSSWKIKNTFIHIDSGRYEDDDPGFAMPLKSISQPNLSFDSSHASLEVEEDPVSSDLPSVGAALHASGKCKPCAWYWKPASCQWGKECCHCHACPEGELRRRKKERLAHLKKGAQQDSAQERAD